MSDLLRLATALGDRYTIERELGHGGMATVYLARDLKHDREVALKLLRPELAAVLGRERFLTEIRLTAKLDHPHILTLIDSGESDGFLWYVLPYIRGENLRARLERDKQLGVDEALEITRDIAGALAYAHQRGVIHRDIKPENILFHEGEAMLADFGIALAVKEAGGNRLTETGLSLGTPHYMSPEQATGDRQVDARSDVYSLGAVLYEMLAGEPPVTGPTVQAMIAKLMTERPTRLRVVRETVTEAIDTAVMKALAKVPGDRFAGTAEFVEALGARGAEHTTSHAGPSRRMWLSGGIALAVLVIAGAVVLNRRGPAAAPASIVDQRQLTFTGGAAGAALSPDGKWLAYIEGDSALMVREVAGGRALSLLRGLGFRAPVWSPEGGSVLVATSLDAIITRDATWEVPRLGGDPRRIAGNAYAYDYSPDGSQVAWTVFDTVGVNDRVSGKELYRQKLPGISYAASVRWSPDGQWLALLAVGGPLGQSIYLMKPDGSSLHPLPGEAHSPGISRTAWNDDGSALYYLVGSRLIRQRINPATGEVRDTGLAVASGLTNASGLSLARNGRSAVFTRAQFATQGVAITLPSGGNSAAAEVRQLSSGTGWVSPPAVSPDGRWVAWTDQTGASSRVQLGPFAGGTVRVLAQFTNATPFHLRWAPDGRRLGFIVGDSAHSELEITDIDGVAPVRVALVDLEGGRPPWSWAPQGIVLPDSAPGSYRLIDPDTRSQRVLAAGGSISRTYTPLLSPDGQTLIVARWRPWGFANDLWLHAAGTGRWMPLTYTGGSDPDLVRWDQRGITAAIHLYQPGQRYEIARSPAAGAPFRTLISGLRWCNGSAPSFSDDLRHLACIQQTGTSDIWIVTGFAGEGR